MTAALDNVTYPGEEQRLYPERITFRVSRPVHTIYDSVEDAYDEDGITKTHRIWAMLDLFWAHGTPEQRRAIQQRARELEQHIREATNEARSVGRLAYFQRRQTGRNQM